MEVESTATEEIGFFDVTPTNDDPAMNAVLARYWAASTTETGRPVFRESVADIARDLGLGDSEVTGVARSSGYATCASRLCPECGDRWELWTRSDFQSSSRGSCPECRRLAQHAAEETKRQETAVAEARRSCVAETLARERLDGPARVEWPRPLTDWRLTELVELWTWLLITGPDGVLRSPEEYQGFPFADRERSRQLAVDRWQAFGLRIDPSTRVDAFGWQDEVDPLPDRFYPGLSSFHLPGSGSLKARVDAAIAELQAVVDRPWPNSWVEEAVDLASSILAAEASRFLDHQLDKHELPAAAGDKRKEFLATAVEALETYTLGECYSLLWRVAKDGAAATRRHPMSEASGTAHAVNQFRKNLLWARQNNWDVSAYNAIDDLPRAWQTHVLFDLVLGVAWMSTTTAQVERTARERLRNDEVIRRYLADGLPDALALRAMGELNQRCQEAPTPLLDAVAAVVRAVTDAGGSASAAIRAGFYSLHAAQRLGETAEDIDECERELLALVAGRNVSPLRVEVRLDNENFAGPVESLCIECDDRVAEVEGLCTTCRDNLYGGLA